MVRVTLNGEEVNDMSEVKLTPEAIEAIKTSVQN